MEMSLEKRIRYIKRNWPKYNSVPDDEILEHWRAYAQQKNDTSQPEEYLSFYDYMVDHGWNPDTYEYVSTLPMKGTYNMAKTSSVLRNNGINDGILVQVQYQQNDSNYRHFAGGVYTFLSSEDYPAGTLVLIDALDINDTKDGKLSVAKVVGPEEYRKLYNMDFDPSQLPPDTKLKWIAGTINITAYNAKKSLIREERELSAALEQRFNELNEVRKYQLLADTDPEMAEKVRRLHELRGLPTSLPKPITTEPEIIEPGNSG